MSNHLVGKRALVTGGSRGIGAAIALALAENGADVALTFQHSADQARQVVASIEKLGRRGIAIEADIGDPVAIRRSVGDAVGALGGLDILVNNAAIARYSTIADFKLLCPTCHRVEHALMRIVATKSISARAIA